MIIFIDSLGELLNKFPPSNETDKMMAPTYCRLIHGQLILMQTFVDDLLTLKQINKNSLRLVNAVFNPNSLFGLLESVFSL